MNDNQRDERLRRAFRELREEDRRAPPSFERLLAQERAAAGAAAGMGRWRPGWFVVAGLGLIALLAALLVARRAPTSMPTEAVASIVAWRSPTESLLRTPGWELARELPRLGDFGFPGLDEIEIRPTGDQVVPLSSRKETIQ